MRQAFNPYLPSYEYIPDGEPHVFGDRVYVYGSHDRFGGRTFCMNDYVCWSAPVGDLTLWRNEGVIYKKTDDPHYRGRGYMYAPDVCLAPDGRYYLYYGMTPGFTRGSWSVRCAVADSPIGPFRYHGEVDLAAFSREYLPFDPAVYVEGGRVWLYYGSGMFYHVLGVKKRDIKGGAVVEIDPADMLTVISPPRTTVPRVGDEVGEHGFFEASSMRRIGGRYYFVYSSALGHELCYATADAPDGPFTYGGTLVSVGDIGLGTHTDPESAADYTGNTHGGLLSVGGRHYVFYHRHTNLHCYSRQACAEEIHISPDGSIAQAERTSCGLNGGPLAGVGSYEARIACSLTSKNGCRFFAGLTRSRAGCHPYFTQTGGDRDKAPDQYIANFCNGATAGFKYFDIAEPQKIGVTVRKKAKGCMHVSTERGGAPVARIDIDSDGGTRTFYGDYMGGSGVKALYFTYYGAGRPDFISFVLE